MLEYLQNPIIFSIAIGLCVSIYLFFEDSFTDQGIQNKTKYVRAFIVTAVGVNVLQTYAKKSSSSFGGNSYQQSYNVGQAPF